jgi:hypothetical protein
LNHPVEEDTIAARVLEPETLPVVLDEPVHGGPPYRWDVRHPIIGAPPCCIRAVLLRPGNSKERSPLPRRLGHGSAD